jgi:hypothetical protein
VKDLESPRGMCPVAPLREAFERSGKCVTEVATAMDWWRPNGVPDGQRVRRSLGILPTPQRTGKAVARRYMRAERASLLAEAIGVMPVEIGL